MPSACGAAIMGAMTLTLRSAAIAGLATAVLAVVFAAAAPAASSREVAGPSGVRVLKPPAAVVCPPGDLRVGVRLTARAKRLRVTSVRVLVDGRSRSWTGRKLRGRVRSTVRVRCDGALVVRYEVRRRGVRRVSVARFKALTADPDARSGPRDDAGGLPDPFGGVAPPGAQAPDPAGAATTWTATVDSRRGGPREGQTCVQVVGTAPDGSRAGAPSFCGDLRLDPVVARTQEVTGPDGAARRVLAGVANPATVASVAVSSPNGTRELPLSAATAGAAPGAGRAFIAVWDASVPTGALTLVVRLKDGSAQSHPSPGSLNVRDKDNNRIG
jgi:hypothetical protein